MCCLGHMVQRLEMREGSMTLPSQLTILVKLSALDLSNNLVKPEGVRQGLPESQRLLHMCRAACLSPAHLT